MAAGQRSLILASASPRRRQLIQLLELPVEIRPADVDERSVTEPDPALNVVKTAQLKAVAVAKQLDEPAVVIAADTTVALDGRMLGKPADGVQARAMLYLLRGRRHQVHTGLAIINTATGAMVTDVATSEVTMRDYSDGEIESYIASGDPLDKAGAYAIQHAGFRPVTALAGCFTNVVGLPLCHLRRALAQLGVEPATAVAADCRPSQANGCSVLSKSGQTWLSNPSDRAKKRATILATRYVSDHK